MAITVVINNDILISIEKTDRDGISCVKLNFQNSPSKYQDIKVFDKTNSAFDIAKKLVGKSVQVTCWDPYNQPGLWSRQDWYKDIYELKSYNKEEMKTKPFGEEGLLDKGSCKICGIRDNFLTYSEDFGKTWMHYRCKFPDF